MQFTAWPEMLAWPYLMINGFLPYKDIGIAHNPLLIFVLTIFYKFFGVGIIQLQIFTALIIIFTTFLVYKITKKWYTPLIYLMLCFAYQGWGLWFDLALAPIAVLLFYFVKKDNWLLAGTIFALGFLTKQTFIYFLIPVLFRKVDLKKFILGAIPVFGIFILYLMAYGLVNSYYYWAIQFGIFYLPHAKGQILLPTIKQFLISFLPFTLLIFNNELIFWILAGVMGIYPRFELFHFQPALPFLAIAISQAVLSKTTKIKYLGIIILIFIVTILSRRIYNERNLETRFYESDVQKTVLTLKNVKSLYVVNYWDNVYALTNTLPAKPLIPYIPWYLNYNNNSELIINNLKFNMPEAIVVNDRQNLNFEKLQIFIGRYYTCNVVEKKVESCLKN